MSKPFKAGDDYVVVCQGKWFRFPTDGEADEFYDEKLEEMEKMEKEMEEMAI